MSRKLSLEKEARRLAEVEAFASSSRKNMEQQIHLKEHQKNED